MLSEDGSPGRRTRDATHHEATRGEKRPTNRALVIYTRIIPRKILAWKYFGAGLFEG
jgi:hypothetical protein